MIEITLAILGFVTGYLVHATYAPEPTAIKIFISKNIFDSLNAQYQEHEAQKAEEPPPCA